MKVVYILHNLQADGDDYVIPTFRSAYVNYDNALAAAQKTGLKVYLAKDLVPCSVDTKELFGILLTSEKIHD